MGWYTGYVRPTWASSYGLGPPMAAAGTARAAKIAPQPAPVASTRANTPPRHGWPCQALFCCGPPVPGPELSYRWPWDWQLDISAILLVVFGFVVLVLPAAARMRKGWFPGAALAVKRLYAVGSTLSVVLGFPVPGHRMPAGWWAA